MEEIKAKNIRPGMVLFMKNNLYRVLDAVYAQRCQSEPSMNLTLKNIRTEKVENNVHVHAGENVLREIIMSKPAKYLYSDDGMGTFLDENSDLVEYPMSKIGDRDLLSTNCDVLITCSEAGDLISIDFPAQMEVTVVERDNNKVITESGLKVNVPDHIMPGDVIRIHTDTKEFISRVNK
jgi:translation elongation factor P/translation initiation factor 5A